MCGVVVGDGWYGWGGMVWLCGSMEWPTLISIILGSWCHSLSAAPAGSEETR